VASIRERVPSLKTVVCVGGPAEGAVAWEDFVAGRPASFAPGTPVAPESVVAFLSTSGSTGSPKLAMLTHANLLSNVLTEAGLYGLGGGDVFACVLPLFHNYALLDSCLLPLYLGATIVLGHHEDAEGLLGLIERHCVSFVALMPAQLSELALRDFGRDHDTSSLRMVQTGGAPLAPAALERFRRRYGLEPLDGYGCSEASSTVTVMPADAPVRPGSVGRPMPNQEVRVVDEDGREVPAGAEGEVVVRGPNVFAGYLGLPEETARALRGGWLHTGDLGRFDADGYLWITGRKKALINVGGMKVCPAEVEAVLQQVEGVQAACVVPSYHPTLGEVVKAFLEVPEGRRVEAAAVLAHCAARLAGHKVPRLVELRPALPRTGSGKVAAAALAEEERRRAWPATAA
jgi:long-chain acyl-CoA synthetase